MTELDYMRASLPRSERMLRLRMHIWGFRVDSRGFLGGGLYPIVLLQLGETVDDVFSCGYARRRWYGSTGCLTITDARLIYTPMRWYTLGREPVIIEYRSVTQWTRRKLWNPIHAFTALFTPALILSTAECRHTLWPNTVLMDEFAEKITSRIEEGAAA